VEEACAFTNDANFEPFRERVQQGRKPLEDVRRVEVLPVERKDERPLAAGLKALAHGGFEQGDAVRSGERGDEHEVFRVFDVALNARQVGTARGRCEKLHVHVELPTTKPPN
jgi:hypothetical protein